MPLIQYRDALREAMTEEMDRDDRVFLMGEEVAEYNGAYKVSEGMLAQFGPKRVIDTPISEAAFSGLAVGAATAGLRPIVEYMSWSFTLVCLDQIVNNAANVRYMSGGQYKVPITFRGGNGIAHQLGATHSHRMESVYSRIPGLIVVAPSTPAEGKGLLKSSIRCDDPVIFLESEKMLNEVGEVPDDPNFTLPIGVANVERTGKDVTIISYGRLLQRVVQPRNFRNRNWKIIEELLAARVHLAHDPELVLRIEVVPEGAGLGVARAVDRARDPAGAADQPAALVRRVLACVRKQLVMDISRYLHRRRGYWT